jgi:hypothetical protein
MMAGGPMWTEFRKFAKDCTTEVDGESYCMFRVGGCLLTLTGVPTFIGLSIYCVVSPEHHFDMVSYGSAFGIMMSAIALLAGGMAFKARGESRSDK